jgi:hypothetical protein
MFSFVHDHQGPLGRQTPMQELAEDPTSEITTTFDVRGVRRADTIGVLEASASGLPGISSGLGFAWFMIFFLLKWPFVE